MNTQPTIEPLEARIAPAIVLNAHAITYIDGDGDLVTVKISKGSFGAAGDPLPSGFLFAAASTGILGREQLQVLDFLGDTQFDGANLSITAKPTLNGGDGTVSVGYINATGIDLGVVTVRGDLGAIDAGDARLSDGGLGSLTVLSLGGEGVGTGAPDLLSDIVGRVRSIKIVGDLTEATITITGAAAGLGSLFVGGSIVGGAATNSGQVLIDDGALSKATVGGDLLGDIGISSGVLQAVRFGAVSVGGSISGGGGPNSGQIFSGTTIAKMTVGGALVGRDGASSGVISAESIGSLNIDGSVFGGTGPDSGKVQVDGHLGKLRIGGSLNGGANDDTGEIFVGGTLSSLSILGSVFGGDADAVNKLENTGYIQADRILSLTVGGSIVAGSDGGGGLLNSGAIRAQHDIVKLTVKGSLEGNASNPVIITAVGQTRVTGATDLAMGAVTILGRVFNSEILAGYSPDLTNSFLGEGINADAQIATVKVGGDWIISDLIAGLADNGGGLFGDANDILIVDADDKTGVISKISSIIIGGRVLGTPASGDAFRTGFGAQQVVSMKVGGVTAIPLFAGRANDTFALTGQYPLGTTRGTFNADGYDVHVYEV